MVRVVHLNKETYDIYIGRGMPSRGLPESPWANPYRIGKDGTREEVIAKYEARLDARLRSEPGLRDELRALDGKTLGCWCAPAACHGHVLARMAVQMTPEVDRFTIAKARMKFEENHLRETLHLLFKGESSVEVRMKLADGSMVGGRFSGPGKVIQAIESQPNFTSVYVVLNRGVESLPVDVGFSKELTRDQDIECRRWLLVDVDAKRTAGTNATDLEHRAALKMASEIRDSLSAAGWPAPIMADSGNGAHLLYRVDLPNDPESKALVNGVLAGLDRDFSTDTMKVDRTVGNAARISKAYGTVSCKQPHTVERPERLSWRIDTPATMMPVNVEQLRSRAIVQAVQQAPTYSAPLAAKGFSMAQFISHHGIQTRPATTYNGDGQRWQMDCPFDKTHKAPDAALFQYSDGAKAFKCSHDSCSHQNWGSFREHFEPGYAQKREARVQAPSQKVAFGYGL